MTTRHLHVVKNPPPDDRSKEEAMIADYVATRLEHRCLGIVVGAEAPGAKKRFVAVQVAIWPWRWWMFARRQKSLEEGVAKLLFERDAEVRVIRMPFDCLLAMLVMRLMEKRAREHEAKDVRNR